MLLLLLPAGSCAAVPMLSRQPRACDGHRGGRDLGRWIGHMVISKLWGQATKTSSTWARTFSKTSPPLRTKDWPKAHHCTRILGEVYTRRGWREFYSAILQNCLYL